MSTTNKINKRRTAVVTGAGEGLGREMALNLAGKGYQVLGTALSANEATELERLSHGGVTLIVCDITSETAVKKFSEVVSAAFGETGLDLLISNVGILTPGPMEALPIEMLRHEFEVDVFGAVRIFNTFLPLLRKARGRIVQISSWSSKLALPFSGPSSACKAALEALADTYRTELRPSGVNFVIVEPGNMRTSAPAKSAAGIKRAFERMTPEQRELYGAGLLAFEATFNGLQNSGLEADEAAALVVEVAEQQPAPARAPIGEEAARIMKMAREKSDRELDDMRLDFFGLKKIPGYRLPEDSRSAGSRPTQDPIAVVRRNTEEVQNKGNFDIFEELFAPNFVDHTPQGDAPPNRDGARALYKMLRGAFPDFEAKIDFQFSDGAERVTTYKTYYGTHLGNFMGHKPTGRKIHFETVDVMRVHGGKITDHWGAANLLSLMQQLGFVQNIMGIEKDQLSAGMA